MIAELPQVVMYTDGACSGNPGRGGWGVILKLGKFERELSGSEAHTTNNRMEIMAVLEGLRALTTPTRVTIYIDSSYVMHAFTKKWLEMWVKNGWVNSAKKPVANRDLWAQLIRVSEQHELEFIKVKGHSGVELNERVDQLAVAACRRAGK